MATVAKKIKRTAIIVAVISATLLGGYIFYHLLIKTNKPVEYEDAYKIAEEVYRPPIVKIPFVTKDKPPIKKESLPILKKEVAKSVEITVPPSEKETKIELVIDKKGKVYKTKDTPDNVEIVVTSWKPALIGIGAKLGYSLIYNERLYHCLSLDVFRIWKIHMGADFGINDRWEFLAGASLRYQFGELNLLGLKTRLLATAGRDFVSKNFYIGLSLRW